MSGQKTEGPERLADVRPIAFPGVNACAICNCGNLTFRVGVGRDVIGNNTIRCLECVKCGHKLAVPFFNDGAPRQ